MSDNFVIPEHRDLTSEERRLLEWLVTNGTNSTTLFAAQISQTKVVARCKCGCPTLDLAVGEKTSRTVGLSTILADAYGHSPEGVAVNVILHAREGELSELEVISMDDTDVFGMPTPETLEIV
ncbi:MAG: hypothetical protein QOG23_4971 [Blastocatellia bacterium]|jgi:hypothetical protein|nr:hypothetical protein [Blastocatellia bacterium]